MTTTETSRPLRRLHHAVELALRPGQPGEAVAAWITVARQAQRVGLDLDALWAFQGQTIDQLGLWPAVVDAWYDAAEEQA